MRRAPVAAVLVLLTVLIGPSGAGALPVPQLWRSIGPPAGTVDALAAAADGSTRYAAGQGGVAISDDGGASWRWVGAAGTADGSLAVDPQHAERLLGSGPGGIVRSIDGGATWTAVIPATSQSGAVAFAPSDGQVAYAALGSPDDGWQVSASDDGGATWHPAAASSRVIAGLVVDPQDPSIVYAEGPGVRRSTDGGVQFTALPAPSGRTLLTVTPDPAAAGRLYATTAHGVLISGDSGTTWSRPVAGISGSTAGQSVVVAGSRLVVLTDAGLWMSTDGGAHWSKQSGAPLVDGAAPLIAASGDLLGPAEGGVARSTDGGAWSVAPLAAGDVTDVAAAPGEPQRLLATVANGAHAVYATSDGGASWQAVDPASGVSLAYAVVYAPGDASTAYVLASDGLYRSLDGGATWQFRSDPARTQLEVDPADPSALYAGELLSRDGGATWAPVGGDLPAGAIPLSVAVAPVLPAVVYAATTQGLYRSVGGAPWQPIESVGSAPVAAVAAAGPATVYAAVDGAILRSDEGGPFVHAGDLPASVAALAASSTSPLRLIASTRASGVSGLWQSFDGGASWQSAAGVDRRNPAAAPSGAPVPVLRFTGGGFLAGTIGRGLYRYVPQPPPQSPVPSFAAGQLVTSHVPVRLGWSRFSSSFDLEVRALEDSTYRTRTTELVVHPAAGVPVSARVRAAGGQWSPDAAFRAGLGDDRWSGLHPQSGWAPVTAPDLLGGRALQSAAAGSVVRATFDGRSVAWVATEGPQRGVARVYLDGELSRVVDLRSEQRQTGVMVFAHNWTAAGLHSMAVVVQSGEVDVDAVAVLH